MEEHTRRGRKAGSVRGGQEDVKPASWWKSAAVVASQEVTLAVVSRLWPRPLLCRSPGLRARRVKVVKGKRVGDAAVTTVENCHDQHRQEISLSPEDVVKTHRDKEEAGW
ncbi:hypothetical protein O3P69_001681 [Scylla paramamosain]|uniref:Uncharacterized protein n=1 Tax=Scylla paramamosain TaxID=85552 RepID=A0AAW0V326_SCYPA